MSFQGGSELHSARAVSASPQNSFNAAPVQRKSPTYNATNSGVVGRDLGYVVLL